MENLLKIIIGNPEGKKEIGRFRSEFKGNIDRLSAFRFSFL
jgi:hypothetical protein